MVSVSGIAKQVQHYQAVVALKCFRVRKVFFHIYSQPVFPHSLYYSRSSFRAEVANPQHASPD